MTNHGLTFLFALLAVIAVIAICDSFVQRRRLADARRILQQRTASTRAILDTIPFPVMVKDSKARYRILNSACRLRLDIDPIKMIGRTSLDLEEHRLQPMADDTPVGQKIHQLSLDAIRKDKLQRCGLDYISSDSHHRIGLFLESPMHDSDGHVSGSVSVLLDITEYREIELSARATEQSLRDITQRIPVAVFAVRRGIDRLPRLAFIAGNLHALFGLAPDDLVETGDVLHDWPFKDRIHVEDVPALKQLLRRATRHMRTSTLDFRAYGAAGLRWIHLVMMTRRLPDSSVEWIGYFIDTTNINAHNEALRAARDAAERASQAKADFLATMSHEIRTPMNGVLGMIELLGHTPLDADQRELLHAVEDSAGVLMQVLNDVLDFSKLESNSLRLDDRPFDLRKLVDNVVSIMTSPMHKKGLHVEVSADAALAGKLLGDSVRIRQILLNLLNNASKFTEHGSVAIRVRVLDDDGQYQRISLSVIDTGIGIAIGAQANLFIPFSQAESWTTRRYGGTGLGLAICRHLAQLMRGTIELSSRPSEGTSVVVQLRLPIIQRKVDAPPSLVNKHAVVHLRSASIANALSAHLTALGLSVERAPYTQPLRADVSGKLLFIDVDDSETLAPKATPAILVDTRSASPTGIQTDGGRVLLNANPLKWQAVLRACSLMGEPGAATIRDAQAKLPTIPANNANETLGRILVAEDHPISQSVIRRQLDMLGWSYDVVGNGKTAYESLCRHDYTMLITDCQMPLMDGYALATQWRKYENEHPQPFRLPIIALTANALDGEIERCHAAGMDDYLSKPVHIQQLDDKIRTWIHLAAATAIEPARAPAPDHVDIFADPGLQTMRAEMLELLIQSSNKDLRRFQGAIADGDNKFAAKALHHVLGALQLFTTDQVISDGHELTERLAGADAQTVEHQIPAYLDRLRHVLTALARDAETS